jgi:hypothetical protein
MDLLQFADSIEGFAEVEEEIVIDESDSDLKAEIEALRQELRNLRREAKQAGARRWVIIVLCKTTNLACLFRKTSSCRSRDSITVSMTNMLIIWLWSRSRRTLL